MPKTILKSQKSLSLKIPTNPNESLRISKKYFKICENVQKSKKTVEKAPEKSLKNSKISYAFFGVIHPS